ncbi:uncharacterized protein [Procambarus clarkii]|uniref:uncharacterized protein isoform X1 n=2 Tax=Procambarus clarkii TaxID=6728 RepID=UPI003744006B
MYTGSSRERMNQIMQDRVLRSGTTGHYPEFKTWIPGDYKTLAVCESDYEDFTHIVRTVHFEDYLQGKLRDTLIPYETEVRHRTLLPDGIKGLWFRVLDSETEKDIMKDGDWFGNVMYKVDFNEFCDKFLFTKKYKAYFMEVIQYNFSASTRILIASPDSSKFGMKSGWGFKESGDEFTLFPEYDHLKPGGPWHQLDNQNRYLSNHRKYFEGTIEKQCNSTLEFFLVLDEADIQQLYTLSDVRSVPHYPDHKKKEGQRSCHKYRSGILHKWCPSHCSIEQTDAVRADIEAITEKEENKVAACHMLQIVPDILDKINERCRGFKIENVDFEVIVTLTKQSQKIIEGLSYEDGCRRQQVAHKVEEILKILEKFVSNELDQIRKSLRMSLDENRDRTMEQKNIVTDRVQTWMQRMIKEIKEHLCQQ